MSRIGKHPIPVPAEVSVSIEAGNVVTVKGPKGTLTQTFHPDMIIKQEGGAVIVNRPDDEHLHKSLHGLTRTLLNNMIVGVEKGYSKDLDIVGVGYKAEKKGNQLVMSLGFSHPVIVDEIPLRCPQPIRLSSAASTSRSWASLPPRFAARDLPSLIRARASDTPPRSST